jgi:hypothetical protein
MKSIDGSISKRFTVSALSLFGKFGFAQSKIIVRNAAPCI